MEMRECKCYYKFTLHNQVKNENIRTRMGITIKIINTMR